MRRVPTLEARIVDASAKGANGMMTGTLFNYGVFAQCTDTESTGRQLVTGKYCLVKIKPSVSPRKQYYKSNEVLDELKSFKNGTVLMELAKYIPYSYAIPLRLGLCVPSGCSESDINGVLTKVADTMGLYMKVNRCDVKDNTEFTPLMIFVMSIYSLAGLMVLLGSAIDIGSCLSQKLAYSSCSRVLVAFSFPANFQMLFDTSSSSKSVSCLNGIRFMSMFWGVLSHIYVFNMFYISGGLSYIRATAKDVPAQAVVNGFMAIETFFFIGGFLMCYLATRHVVVQKNTFSIAALVIRKLFRILPTYAMVILYAFIMDITCSGPAAHDIIEPNTVACRSNWWANLLFINNFYDASNMCWPFSWYVAADFQLYIVSIIILLILFRWPKLGIRLCLAIITASMVATSVITYMKNFPPTFLLGNPDIRQTKEFAEDLFIKPYTHAGPYMLGVITGYLLALRPCIQIPKAVQVTGWSFSILFSLSVIYGLHEWNENLDQQLWKTALYAGCHRVAWSMSIAWIVISCASGQGGVVNYILSLKVWIPLARLTLAAYLLYPIVYVSLAVLVKGPLHPTHSINVWITFSILVGTHGTAFLVYMLVEAPFQHLVKMILPRHEDSQSRTFRKETGLDLNSVEIANGRHGHI